MTTDYKNIKSLGYIILITLFLIILSLRKIWYKKLSFYLAIKIHVR